MSAIIRYYYQAKQTVYDNGFYPEVYWQEKVCTNQVDSKAFLREHAWVILSSGMKAGVIANIFDAFASVYRNWEDVQYILTYEASVKKSSLKVFANRGKVEAIISMSRYVSDHGFQTTLESIQQKGSSFLEQFPFLGPATSKHLAKNIGVNVAKPDRHLVRISQKFGFTTESLCQKIADTTGDKISVVDIVLWRYATLNRHYLSF